MKRLVLAAFALLLFLATTATAASAPQGKEPGLSLGQLTVLVELHHPRGLNRFVREVSDPTSSHYRDYATVESLVAQFGAKAEARKRVLDWLGAHGIRGRLDPTHTFVTAGVSRAQAARVLPPAAGATASGAGLAGARAVPAGLRGAVAGITVSPAAKAVPQVAADPVPVPADRELAGKEPFSSIVLHTGTAGGCAAGSSGGEPGLEPFTPNQYLTAYGHAALHARGIRGEGQTVAVVEGGGFNRSDVVTYAKCFGVEAPPTQVQVIGTNQRLPAEDETTLDLEQLSVGAPGLDRIYVYEAPGSLRAIVLAAGTALGSPGHRPDVISISLGICEPQIPHALGFKDALDNVFAVAAGAGISVLVSSGDQGSSGCRAKDLETRGTTALPLEAVSLPASSPYATAVGGTNVTLSKGNHLTGQAVWNDSWKTGAPFVPWGGGGGVSLLSPRTPWWQADVGGYGPGRKVPDVAALADRFPGYSFFCTAASCESGPEAVPGWGAVGGTSAAAPLTAAGIALANQYAEQRGEPDLGFLNPLIYRLGANSKTQAAAFSDVTLGNNDVSRALGANVVGDIHVDCCAARPGYDWASGWGSLKMRAFAQLAAGAYHARPELLGPPSPRAD